MIDLLASSSHYYEHLAPIWQQLETRGLSGDAYSARPASMWATASRPRREALRGVQPVMVASYVDYQAAYPAPVVYVEHGAGQCLTPETLVLGADLRWKPVGDVSIGDELVAFEEERSDRQWRKWQRSWVTAARLTEEPCYRLLLSDGTKVTASAGHRWLRRDKESYSWLRTDALQSRATHPAHASKLVKVFDTWAEKRSWGSGYLAAAFDGEGSFTQTRRGSRQNRAMLTFTQRDNAMLALVEHELTAHGFEFSRSKPRDDGVLNLNVRGGTREVLRFLGSIRPRRLLARFEPYHDGQMRGIPVEVLESEFVGVREVVALQTTTRTLIAEGFASHNSYGGDPASARFASYSGGDGLDRVILFLSPSESVARRWRDRYPATPAVAVGCPKLDGYHRESGGRHHRLSLPVVALTYHWDCPLVAETLSAFRHYERCLPRLAEWARWQGIELLGHSHPRIWRHVRGRYERAGIEPVELFDEVVGRAGALCFDNTSAGFEFASLDRPVVVMNAPWYRRDVDHGGRFWQWADVGVQVDDPIDLPSAVTLALLDPAPVRRNRQRIVADVYAHTDGGAATRAAAAIADVLATFTGDTRPVDPRGF